MMMRSSAGWCPLRVVLLLLLCICSFSTSFVLQPHHHSFDKNRYWKIYTNNKRIIQTTTTTTATETKETTENESSSSLLSSSWDPIVFKKREEIVNKFCKELIQSLETKTFEEFLLRDDTRKKRKRRGGDNTNTNNDKITEEELRGTVREVRGRLIAIRKKNSSKASEKKQQQQQQLHLQINMKYYGTTDVAKNIPLLLFDNNTTNNNWKIDINQSIRNLLLLESQQNKSNNNSSSSSLLFVSSEWETSYNHLNLLSQGQLRTFYGTWHAKFPTPSSNNNNNKITKTNHHFHFVQNNNNNNNNLQKQQQQQYNSQSFPLVQDHDREKNVPISPSSTFLQALGVSNANGKPRPGMSSKLRQCQKFVDIVGGLINDIIITTNSKKNQNQKHQNQHTFKRITSVDMGCGRGYLTFSLHSYLMKHFSSSNNNATTEISSLGIEMRPKLVQETNNIANALKDEFHGNTIQFQEGTIADITTTKTATTNINTNNNNKIEEEDELSILIALHACDTATDDALYYGIHHQKADLIVTAPCCHKQIRWQLDQHISSSSSIKHPLSDVLRHNIYKERISESITDSIRALLLEIAGYNVQVFEFIGGEHTSKNVMITATKIINHHHKKTKTTKTTSSLSSSSSSESSQKDNNADDIDIDDDDNNNNIDDLRNRLIQLAEMHGIRQQRLAFLMGEHLVHTTTTTNNNIGTTTTTTPERRRRRLPGHMPAI